MSSTAARQARCDMAVTPTKGNLINLKKSLALAENGYEMLDRRRNILVKEMMSLIDDASQIQEKINESYSLAYSALQKANVSMGITSVQNAAGESDDSVTLSYRSVMGVEIPTVHTDRDSAPLPNYTMHRSSPELDRAHLYFNEVKLLTAKLAQVENSVYRLAFAVKKTRKRANSLKNIVIPRFRTEIKQISDYLEEKEREEFSRLKVIKGRKRTY